MKRVQQIRNSIASIPGIFREIEPEQQDRGAQYAIEQLWDVSNLPDDKATLNVNPIDQEDPSDENTDGRPKPVEEIFEFPPPVNEQQMVDALGAPSGDAIRKAVEINGTDALGWYVNFHVKGAQWGIYIPISGLVFMIADVFSTINADLSTKIRIAFRAIHQHELFHFATDYMSSQLEGIVGSACYIPAQSLKDPKSHNNQLEEELANAHMIRSFWGGESLKIKGKTELRSSATPWHVLCCIYTTKCMPSDCLPLQIYFICFLTVTAVMHLNLTLLSIFSIIIL